MSENHVPGLYRCAVCGFELMQSSLRASDGAISDRDNPGERCPNDGHLLGRVTWKLHAEDLAERATEYLSRAVKAEAALQPLSEVREVLSDLLEMYDDDEGCRAMPQYTAGRALLAALPPATSQGDGE